jgi:hypothetical protein
LAQIVVSGGDHGVAVFIDGLKYPRTAAYYVADTYENKIIADALVQASLISIAENFTATFKDPGRLIPAVSEAPVNAVAATLTTSLDGDDNDLVYTARTKGAAGENIKIKYTDPNKATEACVATLTGSGTATDPYVIDVTLKHDGNDITATAANVKAAIEANDDADKLVEIDNANDDDGTGTVTAMPATALDNGEDGTVAGEGRMVQKSGVIYFTTADNSISDANWLKIVGTALSAE